MKSSFFRLLVVILSLPLSMWGGAKEEPVQTMIVCENGLDMYQWDLDFIRQASVSIDISPTFLGGKLGRDLLSAIEERMCAYPNLQVYILTTVILFEQEDIDLITRLQHDYPLQFHIEYTASVPIIFPDLSAIDNHLKMVVVDETYFSTGGTNLEQNQATEGTWTPPKEGKKISSIAANLPAAMRDQDVVGKGPMAKQLREIFHRHYALWEYYNKTGKFVREPDYFDAYSHYFPVDAHPVVERFERSSKRHFLRVEEAELYEGGVHQVSNEITSLYVKLINQAKEEILISNLYFCPNPVLMTALLDAVNRGVKVTLLTNGVGEIPPAYTQCFCWANRINYVPLFYGKTFCFWDAWGMKDRPRKNTQIFEYHVKDVVLHKKVMIIDSKEAIVGSYNLGFRSHCGDYELAIHFRSAEVVRELKRIQAIDLQYAREVSAEEACGWYFDPGIAMIAEAQKRFHGLI